MTAEAAGKGGADVVSLAIFSPIEMQHDITGRDGAIVEVLRELGDDERDVEVGPMFAVKFDDGLIVDAFIDELETFDGYKPESKTLRYVDEDTGWEPL